MKKKNLKNNGLQLNKNVISNFSSEELKGGLRTQSCIADADTNCATDNCGSGNCSAGCQSNGCPPSQQPGCLTAFFPCQTISCPGAGIC